jgi:thymidine kinase
MFAHQNMSTNHFNPNYKNYGYLQLILGPMYSGKTSMLLELKKQYTYSKMSCCVINYAEDKRYHESKLSTHDKKMIECHNTLNIESFLTNEIINQHQVFLINEGQFFKNLKKCVVDLVEKYNKIVHVCGLDGDFKRDAFGEILELIPLCDDIVKKKAICSICENGTPALFSKRLVESSEVKLIGSDIYKPVCRSCYNTR